MSWVSISIQKASILLLFKEQKPADVALEQSKHERIGTALQIIWVFVPEFPAYEK